MRGAIAGLADVAGGIGDPHVRNRGTIGGSVANNDPAADYPAALLALGATIATNKREIKADDFFKGLFSTALGDGEIITAHLVPGAGQVRLRQVRQPGLALCAGRRRRGADRQGGPRRRDGRRQQRRLPPQAAEAALGQAGRRSRWPALPPTPTDMMSDIHADAAYRAHLVGVMARRAVAKAG